MAIGRWYIADSGLVAISATGLSGPLLYYSTPATTTANLAKIKVSCEVSGSVPTVPSNSDLFFTFNKATGTKAGGAAVTANPTSADTLASNITMSSGSTTITGLTQSTELWAGTVPFTAGAFSNEDEENTGLEVFLGQSLQFAFYVTVPAGPGAGSNMFARVIAWHEE